MKSFWNDKDRTAIVQRLHQLKPDTQPIWGKMNAAQIVSHLSDQLRVAYGEIHCEDARGVLRVWPLNLVVMCMLPWPRGAPSPKEAWTTPPAAWQEDIRALEQLINQFSTKDRDGPWPHHPLFGKMSGTSWGLLSHRHFDHHLRQFGA